ncbi:MAG: sugar ABC transporter substrate-binding protein [Candidatus Firestonebacteria bacterium]
MFKRRANTLNKICIFLFIVIVVISGCVKKDKKVVLRFANWITPGASGRYIYDLIAEFEKTHPGVEIKSEFASGQPYWRKLYTSHTSGNAPDIFCMVPSQLVRLSSKGMMLPLDEFLAKEEFGLNDYQPNIRKVIQFREKVWMLPLGFHSFVLYYNKTMFDKEKIKYPDKNWGWSDFLDAAKKLTKDTNGDGRIDQYGFSSYLNINYLSLWIYGNGGRIVDESGKKVMLDHKEAIEALQFISDLINKYKVVPREAVTTGEMQSNVVQDYFANGKAGMFILGAWCIPRFREEIKSFDWDIAPFPKGKANRRCNLINAGISISSQTKHSKLAWEFVKQIAGPVGVRLSAKAGQDIPALNDKEAKHNFLTAGEKPKNIKLFFEALEYSEPTPLKMGFESNWDKYLKPGMESLMLGNESAEKMMKRIGPELQKGLDEFWKDLEVESR